MKKSGNDKEIEGYRTVIRFLKKGWGANCATRDVDDVPNVTNAARCGSCEAREVIEFLEKCIEYAKE